MRSPIASVVMVILLTACSDRAALTGVRRTGRAAGDRAPGREGRPLDGRPTMPPPATSDPAAPLSQLQTMVAASLTQVPVPPDGYSHAADAVHPDLACAAASWNTSQCWVTYTPYMGSDPQWENPSFLTAQNPTRWQLPDGVANPVIPWGGPGHYNSDPDQAFDPGTGRLITYYREVSGGFNNIYATSTGDGRHWSTPVLAFRERDHDAVSPAIVIDDDRTARMWYVRSGVGCSSGNTSIRMRTAHPAASAAFERAVWSDPTDVALQQPGFTIWHLDVLALPDHQGYVALYAAHAPTNDCASNDLWIAISPDGVRWHTFPVPVMWRGMPAARKLKVRTWYRGTMSYDAATDTLHLWPSALTADGRWNVYHAAFDFSELVRTLLSATPADQPTDLLQQPSRVSAALRNRMP
ncbi:MAG TPA: hypothetical protein VFT41_13455 [Gemmatimonadaceae bacterium]|nr:hypothetical protein [Gemmatimonadaceae bacterium]